MGSQARLSCNKHIWLKVLGIREKKTLSVDVTGKKILMDESYTLITNLTLPEKVGIPKHRSLKERVHIYHSSQRIGRLKYGSSGPSPSSKPGHTLTSLGSSQCLMIQGSA